MARSAPDHVRYHLKTMQYTRALAALLAFSAGAAGAQTMVTSRDAAKIAAAAKANIVKKLKDPGSAKFRGLFISASEFPDGGKVYTIHSLCGEVNAKNSYGGYSGFRRFVANAIAPGGQIDDPDDNAAAYAFQQGSWDVRCANKVRDVR